MANVLIIDDDKILSDLLVRMIRQIGHDPLSSLTLDEGLLMAESGSFDVVLLDVHMPDGDGLKYLPKIKEVESAPEVIIITGEGNPDGAEMAIRNGAWGYLPKPLELSVIELNLERVLQYRSNQQQATLRQSKPLIVDDIIGSSRQLKECFTVLRQAAGSDANVLLTGETGTGKELFARAIHFNSSRLDANLVVVDCAALPETLVESSLFGYQKGAFTGADKSVEGLIKQADKGTLFLDEIGELSLSLQKKFLRVLQEKKYRPLGANSEISVDFRVVAATNQDLEKMVRAGLFREDLLYRLRSISMHIPPLRERDEDIKEIAFHYIVSTCKHYGFETKGVGPDFLEMLDRYAWPGNVRELINAIEGAVSEAGDEPIIFFKHMPDNIRIAVARSSASSSENDLGEYQVPGNLGNKSGTVPLPYRDFREKVLSDPEKKYLQELMVLTHGNIKEACRISGLSRTHLYNLMKKYEVSRLGWNVIQ